mgnify:CR=1 FL=1
MSCYFGRKRDRKRHWWHRKLKFYEINCFANTGTFLVFFIFYRDNLIAGCKMICASAWKEFSTKARMKNEWHQVQFRLYRKKYVCKRHTHEPVNFLNFKTDHRHFNTILNEDGTNFFRFPFVSIWSSKITDGSNFLFNNLVAGCKMAGSVFELSKVRF